MQSNEMSEFKRSLKSAFFPVQVPDDVVRLWWNSLLNYSLIDVQQAISRAVMDPERRGPLDMPAVMRKLGGDPEKLARLAWNVVFDALKYSGAWVDFGDPAITGALMEINGLNAIGEASPRELQFMRREFCEAYKRMRESGRGTPGAIRCGEGMLLDTVKVELPSELRQIAASKSNMLESGEKRQERATDEGALKNVMERVRGMG